MFATPFVIVHCTNLGSQTPDFCDSERLNPGGQVWSKCTGIYSVLVSKTTEHRQPSACKLIFTYALRQWKHNVVQFSANVVGLLEVLRIWEVFLAYDTDHWLLLGTFHLFVQLQPHSPGSCAWKVILRLTAVGKTIFTHAYLKLEEMCHHCVLTCQSLYQSCMSPGHEWVCTQPPYLV